MRPRSITLWLAEPDVARARRHLGLRLLLARRGLQLRACADTRSYKKLFPAVSGGAPPDLPLVTTDDDIVYPRWWLTALLAGHARYPQDVLCQRARRIPVRGGRPAHYVDWPLAASTEPAAGVIATGVSGVLYPVAMQQALRSAGDGFQALTPDADDLWLWAVAGRAGVAVRQLAATAREFPPVLGSSSSGLERGNIAGGGNDRQLAALLAHPAFAGVAATLMA